MKTLLKFKAWMDDLIYGPVQYEIPLERQPQNLVRIRPTFTAWGQDEWNDLEPYEDEELPSLLKKQAD